MTMRELVSAGPNGMKSELTQLQVGDFGRRRNLIDRLAQRALEGEKMRSPSIRVLPGSHPNAQGDLKCAR